MITCESERALKAGRRTRSDARHGLAEYASRARAHAWVAVPSPPRWTVWGWTVGFERLSHAHTPALGSRARAAGSDGKSRAHTQGRTGVVNAVHEHAHGPVTQRWARTHDRARDTGLWGQEWTRPRASRRRAHMLHQDVSEDSAQQPSPFLKSVPSRGCNCAAGVGRGKRRRREVRAASPTGFFELSDDEDNFHPSRSHNIISQAAAGSSLTHARRRSLRRGRSWRRRARRRRVGCARSAGHLSLADIGNMSQDKFREARPRRGLAVCQPDGEEGREAEGEGGRREDVHGRLRGVRDEDGCAAFGSRRPANDEDDEREREVCARAHESLGWVQAIEWHGLLREVVNLPRRRGATREMRKVRAAPHASRRALAQDGAGGATRAIDMLEPGRKMRRVDRRRPRRVPRFIVERYDELKRRAPLRARRRRRAAPRWSRGGPVAAAARARARARRSRTTASRQNWGPTATRGRTYAAIDRSAVRLRPSAPPAPFPHPAGLPERLPT